MRHSFKDGVVFNFADEKYKITKQKFFSDEMEPVIKPIQFNKKYNQDVSYRIDTLDGYEPDCDAIVAESKSVFCFTYFVKI